VHVIIIPPRRFEWCGSEGPVDVAHKCGSVDFTSGPSIVIFTGYSVMHASILPKAAVSKQHVSRALAAGWSRVTLRPGKGAFADKIEVTTRTIDNALSGTTLPELHTAFNSLLFDHTALDEVVALYGFCLTPKQAEPANDLLTAAGVLTAMSDLIGRLADGVRDHVDTLAIADLLRPHMPALGRIVVEADELRGLRR